MDTTRRQFLKAGTSLAATALPLGSSLAQTETSKAVRFGFIGLGNRGTHLLKILLNFPGVEVRATCDLVKSKVDHAAALISEKTGISPEGYCGDEHYYRNMLERDDIDAVVIATSIKWHGPMSIDAMNRGKHVGSEVPACRTLDECRRLVEAKEKNKVLYYMMENYLFSRRNMAVLRMLKEGLLGEPYYLECGYLHEFKAGHYNPDGSLNWRGEVVNYDYGNHYPTHSGGPVFKALRINEGDRLTRLTCYATTPNRTSPEYYGALFREARADRLPFRLGEMTTCLIRTHRGKVVKMDLDVQSNRPASYYYLYQGTKGIYDTRFGISIVPSYPTTLTPLHPKWTEADEYLSRHEDPLWREYGGLASESGHGGGDYFTVRELYLMTRDEREPWIDVYDAAHWSSIYECSQQSLDRDNATIDIPDFTDGKWRDPEWRAARVV